MSLHSQKRPVFGNDLVRINKYKGGDALENNLPEFLVRAIKKIEDMKWTNGLYRVSILFRTKVCVVCQSKICRSGYDTIPRKVNGITHNFGYNVVYQQEWRGMMGYFQRIYGQIIKLL